MKIDYPTSNQSQQRKVMRIRDEARVCIARCNDAVSSHVGQEIACRSTRQKSARTSASCLCPLPLPPFPSQDQRSQMLSEYRRRKRFGCRFFPSRGSASRLGLHGHFMGCHPGNVDKSPPNPVTLYRLSPYFSPLCFLTITCTHTHTHTHTHTGCVSMESLNISHVKATDRGISLLLHTPLTHL